MKKYIKSSWCLFLLVALASCDTDDDNVDLHLQDLGGQAYLTDRSISVFDENQDLNINLNTTDNVQVESVEILQDGEVLTEATVSGETASFNTSALGELEAGESYSLNIRSTLSNGQTVVEPVTITVADAITIEDDPGRIRLRDTTSTPLSFSTYARYGTVDNVNLYWKRNADGTYRDTGETLDPSGDEIDLGDIDFDEMNLSVGDTIYYRFEAQSGDITETAETQVAIQTQTFESSNEATLSNDPAMAHYDLEAGEYVDADSAEIEFFDPQGFQTSQGVSFVEVSLPDDMTAEEYFTTTDLFEAEQEFQQGSPMTSVENVEQGDVFIYSVVRQNENDEDVVYYGIIRIGDTTVINQADVSLDFEYTEGTILRE